MFEYGKKNFRAGRANQTAFKNMIKDFSRADYTNKNCYSNIKMRTNMAEQAAENNCYTIVRKKVAELAAPTKLLFNL